MSRLETTAWDLTDGDGVCRAQLLQIWPGEAEYSSTALLGPAEAGGAGASDGEQIAVAYERDTKYTGATDQACSGICSVIFAVVGLKHDDNEAEWSPLKGLPTLPKPHHSYLGSAPLFLDPANTIAQDVVRITGSCSLYACFGDRHSCDLPNKPCQNDTAGRAAVEACVALAKPHNATIAINFSPWYCAYKRDEALSDPSNDSPKAKEQEAAEIALWKTNLGKVKLWLEGRAAVSAVLVDSE